ncbi:hypothetical protein [Roseomonas populi]|uniref:Uncharacterized protein n=1 Tax=Roseomonas populi TaxID=3121582 RepID=A0ABT1X264_9PROT|nr:hypothetical protein [Roseomonas pecuniae]MCR0981819.1 hypothetical protein [Roseomonas pecuniae]
MDQLPLDLLTGSEDMVTASRPWPEECTPALRRVLEKARSCGCVRRAGIYADRPQEDAAKEPGFDWQTPIDRCVALGWLNAGEAFNTYVLTAQGSAQLAKAADDVGGAP